ncbi:hypothetical protein NSERUTF1_4841 [Nocardia seriolae]|nr:hypothetical protein NSERUTF1_4841 [Nocardia seriolae]
MRTGCCCGSQQFVNYARVRHARAAPQRDRAEHARGERQGEPQPLPGRRNRNQHGRHERIAQRAATQAALVRRLPREIRARSRTVRHQQPPGMEGEQARTQQEPQAEQLGPVRRSRHSRVHEGNGDERQHLCRCRLEHTVTSHGIHGIYHNKYDRFRFDRS